MIVHHYRWNTTYTAPPFNINPPTYANCPDCWKVEQPFVNIVLIVVDSFAILLRMILQIMGVVVMINFNKGLKEVFAKQRKHQDMYSYGKSDQLEILLDERGEIMFRNAK